MYATPRPTRCPECTAYRELLAWIAEQLCAATIKKLILAAIATALARGADLTARAPAWLWFPIHMADAVPCHSFRGIDAQYVISQRLSRCDCRGGRDIGWRRFTEVMDIRLDAAYMPPRCRRCGFESEGCVCRAVQEHLEAIERLRRGRR